MTGGYHVGESHSTTIGENMANENVSKFEELLRTDEALQARLQELSSSFEGDKADFQAFFDATIGKLAAEAGLPFTMEEGRDSFAFDLSDAELDAVAGGDGLCWIQGYTDGPEAECGSAEFHVCFFSGISIPDCS